MALKLVPLKGIENRVISTMQPFLGANLRMSEILRCLIGHVTVLYFKQVAKPLICSEAEGDLVVIETST